MEQLSGLVFLFLAVCIGYAASALKLIGKGATDILPQLMFNICYPAMILETFSSIDIGVLLGSGLPVAVATIVLTFILLFGSMFLFRKLPAEQRALYIFLAGVGNVTYVAIPLFEVFLSSQAVLVAILHGAAQDPLIWSIYNPLLLSSQHKSKNPLKEILTTPCLIATFIGLIMVFTGFRLPNVLMVTVSRISSITSPIALLLIGILIHQYGLFSWIGDRRALVYSLVRVLVFPIVIGLMLLPFLDTATTILLAALFATPGPLMAVAWATQAKSQVEFTIHCFLFSTMLYLAIFAPLLIFLSPYL